MTTLAQVAQSINYTFADGTTVTYDASYQVYVGGNDVLEVDNNDNNLRLEIYYPTIMLQAGINTPDDLMAIYIGDRYRRGKSITVGDLEGVAYEDSFVAISGRDVPRYTTAFLLPNGSGLIASTNPLYEDGTLTPDFVLDVLESVTYREVDPFEYQSGNGTTVQYPAFLVPSITDRNRFSISDYSNTLSLFFYFAPQMAYEGITTNEELLVWFEGADAVDLSATETTQLANSDALAYRYMAPFGDSAYERRVIASIMPDGTGLVALLFAQDTELVYPETLEGILDTITLGEMQTYTQLFSDGSTLDYSGEWVLANESVYRLRVNNGVDIIDLRERGHLQRFDDMTLVGVLQDYLNSTTLEVTLTEQDVEPATVAGQEAIRYVTKVTEPNLEPYDTAFYAWVMPNNFAYVALIYGNTSLEIVDEGAALDLINQLQVGDQPIDVVNVLPDGSEFTYSGKWFIDIYNDFRVRLASDEAYINFYLYGGQATAKRNNELLELLQSDLGDQPINDLNLRELTLAGYPALLYHYSQPLDNGSSYDVDTAVLFLSNNNAYTVYSASYFESDNVAKDEMLAIVDSIVPSDYTVCWLNPARNKTKLRVDPNLDADFSVELDTTDFVMTDGYTQVDDAYWYRIVGDNTGWLRADSASTPYAGTCDGLSEISYP